MFVKRFTYPSGASAADVTLGEALLSAFPHLDQAEKFLDALDHASVDDDDIVGDVQVLAGEVEQAADARGD